MIHLLEKTMAGPSLRVDREAGVIYGVRILGPESRNTYAVKGVTGTEYSQAAHNSARPLYEGVSVYVDHEDRGRAKVRSARSAFGRLRSINTKLESGRPATYGNLHYLRSHELAESVAEDAERVDLGVFGLSHDAFAGKERVDHQRKRLVIESITSVNSVDLVTSAATNRNLRESLDSETWSMPLVAEYVPAQDWKEFAKRIRAGW